MAPNTRVPDKIIKERSGHLSMDGLHQYQRTTSEQEENVSKVLASGSSIGNLSFTTGINS